jgi:hypothetical protein
MGRAGVKQKRKKNTKIGPYKICPQTIILVGTGNEVRFYSFNHPFSKEKKKFSFFFLI